MTFRISSFFLAIIEPRIHVEQALSRGLVHFCPFASFALFLLLRNLFVAFAVLQCKSALVKKSV